MRYPNRNRPAQVIPRGLAGRANRRPRSPASFPLLCLVGLSLLAGWSAAEPIAGLLLDDTWTRGNWIGRYGSTAYVLFGARSPTSLTGGPGWPLRIHGYTGDPAETSRAWLSLMNTSRDDRALLLPQGGKRVASSWDDHGETRPIGQGPGLFIDIDLPPGRLLVSLYFFEIDWIQYRAYALQVVDRAQARVVLETSAADFFDGKYKRFALEGPRQLTFKILPGTSPNALCSGLFLDPLPDRVELPESLAARPDEAVPEADIESHCRTIRERLDPGLTLVEQTGNGEKDYLDAEAGFFRLLARLERERPAVFYSVLAASGSEAQGRLARFLRATLDPRLERLACDLDYAWARLLLDLPRQEQALRRLEQLSDVTDPRSAGSGLSARERPAASEIQAAFADPDDSQRAEILRRAARRRLQSGDLDGAAQVLGHLYRASPDTFSSEDHYLYACGLLYTGETESADGHLAQALAKGLEADRAASAYVARIACQVQLERLDAAEQLLAEFEGRFPHAVEVGHACFELGKKWAGRGNSEQARKLLRKALERQTSADGLATAARGMLQSLDEAGP
ncbi:MAG: tetratricopeptide repeat protein [Planctomycetes bacterium]|nr:tetratricopeptide repeat protein [Planctomycetota bacterium]